MGKIIKLALSTALGRWVTGGVVVLLLGGAGLMWHNHKQGLREEGKQECVQEVNQETMKILQSQLAAERAVNVQLVKLGVARDAVNAEATARHQSAVAAVSELRRQMDEQERDDETYYEWANTSLPIGVANRLQLLQTTDSESPFRDDSR